MQAELYRPAYICLCMMPADCWVYAFVICIPSRARIICCRWRSCSQSSSHWRTAAQSAALRVLVEAPWRPECESLSGWPLKSHGSTSTLHVERQASCPCPASDLITPCLCACLAGDQMFCPLIYTKGGTSYRAISAFCRSFSLCSSWSPPAGAPHEGRCWEATGAPLRRFGAGTERGQCICAHSLPSGICCHRCSWRRKGVYGLIRQALRGASIPVRSMFSFDSCSAQELQHSDL